MNSNSAFNWQDIFKSPNAGTVEIHPAQKHLSDGILRYRNTGKCSAIELKRSFAEADGKQAIVLILLLEGNSPKVIPGDRIKYNGETFEIAKVEFCRSITGETIARRCTVK